MKKMKLGHVTAWYCYAFAAEVFAACAMAIFLPIMLEYLARDIGFISPELDRPCCLISADDMDGTPFVCKAKILGIWVDTTSFSMYVKSIAVALQALCIISIGPLADSPYWRKRLLITFALIGSLSGTLFFILPSSPSHAAPVIAALLTIAGNICYAVANVCNNAFLPSLAKEDETVKTARSEAHGSDEGEGGAIGFEEASSVGPLSARFEPLVSAISIYDLAEHQTDFSSPQTTYEGSLSRATSRLSSIGTAIGFFSGVSVLTLLLIPVATIKSPTTGLKVAIALSGVWWGVFSIPAAIGLPGGSKDLGESNMRLEWMRKGWKRAVKMVRVKEIRAIPSLYMFLLAWVFLSDGFHTTTYVAILYASSTLHMSTPKVILIGILVQLAAVLSSVLAPRVQHRLGYTNLKLLLSITLLAELLPIYTCLGLILPWGGLRSEGEMYVAAVWFGMLYGPFNSYSRAVYAELIPPGHESSFFSLFALTDKSASFLGPLVVGLISDLTGNIRLGFLFLLIMLALPIPVLLRVRMVSGREEAKRWSEQRLDDDETEGLLRGREVRAS